MVDESMVRGMMFLNRPTYVGFKSNAGIGVNGDKTATRARINTRWGFE
jgi:hypothetical protein